MTGARRLGVGIVGLGWVAEQHVQAWRASPHCDVVALCSRDRQKAEAWGQRFALGSQAYDDFGAMLRDPRLDIVSICTINDQHAAQAIAAAEAGKHVLIEKPVAMTLADLRAVQAAIARAGVKSQVSFELHWSPFFQMLHGLLAVSALGDVYYGEFDYFSGNWAKWYAGWDWVKTAQSGGSAFLAAGCHAVDAMRQFMPGEAVEVTAFAGNYTRTYEFAQPTICALVRFSSGAIGKVASIIEGNTPYAMQVRLHGPRGTIVQNRVVSELFAGQTGWAEIPTVLPDTPQVAHHPFQGEMDDLAEAILSDRPALVNIQDAARTHELIFAAEQSAAEGGRPVRLPLP